MGESGAAFFDLYTDPCEESGKMLPTFPEGNVQRQDGSLTLYGGAKSPGVDRESNWLPASGPFSLYIRAYWAGEPHPRWSVETAACQASTIGSSLRRARRGSEMRTRTIYRTSVVGT